MYGFTHQRVRAFSLTTSTSRLATYAGNASVFAERADAMGLRKRLANRILGTDIDELCLAWYDKGSADGFEDGVNRAVNDIVTDLLSDAVLAIELDVEMMQRIVDIVEN